MARIKCKYYRLTCTYGDYTQFGRVCHHHDYSFDAYDDCCDYGKADPRMLEDGTFEIPLQCEYVYREPVMFEKSVRWYELDSEELQMRKLTIPVDRIKHLVIDGETIIDEEERDGR